MHLILSLILVVCLSYEVLAAPSGLLRPVRKSRSFRVERVKRSNYVRDGSTAIRKAYRKYGISASQMDGGGMDDFEPFFGGFGGFGGNGHQSSSTSSSSSDSSTDSDQEGTVTATSVEGGSEFVSPVVIGGQNITLDFDTGSADMWVMNTLLSSSATKGHETYDPEKSSTFQYVNGEFDISYGDSSSAAGYLGQDTVNIGGAIVKNQVFGLPVEVSSEFIEDTSSNGLVGLSFSSLNSFEPGPQKTFFDNIAAELEEPVFTARLRSDGVGEYGFGKIDHSLYTGIMANISIDSSAGFWQFDSTQYAVGSGATREITNVTAAIADTGTTLLLLSPDVVEVYYEAVKGSSYSSSVGGYIYPCSVDLPNLTLGMGSSFKAVVPGSVLEYAEVGTNKTSGETMCYGGVQSCSGSDFQIFGDMFLRSYYVVFDKRGPSLGVATHT
ncbi:aspergillopepsin A-like aspartic endopeptidase [Penicillium angulare]|uniref:aspergillopepsin A-like aspartic endopeptidase n=1 Tax=Penicillium angulare TaxID=116970 RepID=UPI002540C7B1|nr:aspergillopepsin A-like aspartic endopeptidase [Penicillium angulare]KAJ5279135.1 aspergillopepsin A-like aspartic endopeptidase [Penicillium angulare]